MTEQRDTDRLIRAFLDEGRTELPDRAYDAVRAHIDRTRQRVVIGPWREPRMSSFARLAIGAAAVLLVGVVGFGLVGGGRPPNGVVATPTPTTPAAAVPSPSPLVYSWPSALAPGTYGTTLLWDVPFTTTFTVPAGWTGMDVEIRKDPTMMVGFLLVDGLYSDPCAAAPVDPKPDPEIGALVDAVATIPGVHATPAVPVTFGGSVGRYLELEVDAAGCSLDTFALWDLAGDRFRAGMPNVGQGPWPASYPHHRVWILDAGGERYVIDAAWSSGATTADLAELQSIVDSIRIAVPETGGAAADCRATLTDTSGSTDPLTAPYVVNLGGPLSTMLGPVPSPLPSLARPLAQVNFHADGTGWGAPDGGSFRPTVSLIGPGGTNAGLATVTPVNGLQGSFVLDAPGIWLAELNGVAAACPHAFLFEATTP